jgi:hypothetical protein
VYLIGPCFDAEMDSCGFLKHRTRSESQSIRTWRGRQLIVLYRASLTPGQAITDPRQRLSYGMAHLRGISGGFVNLTAHRHSLLRSIMLELLYQTCPHGIVLTLQNTGANLKHVA